MIYLNHNVCGIDKLNQINSIEIFYYINKLINRLNAFILNVYIKN